MTSISSCLVNYGFYTEQLERYQQKVDDLEKLIRVTTSDMQKLLKNGEDSTGNHARDFVISAFGTLDSNVVELYEKINEEIRGYAGEAVLMLLTEEKNLSSSARHPYMYSEETCHLGFLEDRPISYNFKLKSIKIPVDSFCVFSRQDYKEPNVSFSATLDYLLAKFVMAELVEEARSGLSASLAILARNPKKVQVLIGDEKVKEWIRINMSIQNPNLYEDAKLKLKQTSLG